MYVRLMNRIAFGQIPKSFNHMPAVTILMPVYNAERYIEEAIQSVLEQSFTDYTLLIINDGSDDLSENIIKGFRDTRIRYIQHGTNLGLTSTLNEGLDLAEGKYLIRMDADDISLPGRFKAQVAFMDANPHISISGTWFLQLGSKEPTRTPVSPAECEIKLLENSVLGHPTVIMRLDSIRQHHLKFDAEALHAEDYKFWADAALCGLKIANIPKVLLHYRIHDGQVSASKNTRQLESAGQVRLGYARAVFGDALKNKSELYAELVNRCLGSFPAFKEARILAGELKAKNRAGNYFDAVLFDAYMDVLLSAASTRIYILCVDCNLKTLAGSVFDRCFYAETSTYQKAKFIFKSLF